MNTTKAVLLAVVLLVAGYLLRTFFEPPPVDNSREIQLSNERAKKAEHVRDSLLLEVARRDTADAELVRIYLADLARADSLRLRYVPTYTRIAGADVRLLHYLADSLLAGYLVNRYRHRLLLDRRSETTP